MLFDVTQLSDLGVKIAHSNFEEHMFDTLRQSEWSSGRKRVDFNENVFKKK